MKAGRAKLTSFVRLLKEASVKCGVGLFSFSNRFTMKKIKNTAWNLLLVLIFGYCVIYSLPGCGDKPVTPTIVEKPKPRIIPDSEFCASIAPKFATSRAVGAKGRYWINGQTIKINLIGGTAQQRAYFTNAVLEWQKHINLNVSYVTTGVSDVRVSFNSGSGSWSHCGTDAKSVPQSEPTINIAWNGSPVNLHELAHMWGGQHEQASPNSDIQWNKPVVYAALGGSPNFWSKQTVDWNVFRKLTPSEADATAYDPNSILQYSVPASWVYNYPNGIPGGDKLSALDIEFWSKKYPKAAPPPPPPTTYTVTQAQRNNLKRITGKVVAANNAAKVASDSLKIITDQLFGQ